MDITNNTKARIHTVSAYHDEIMLRIKVPVSLKSGVETGFYMDLNKPWGEDTLTLTININVKKGNIRKYKLEYYRHFGYETLVSNNDGFHTIDESFDECERCIIGNMLAVEVDSHRNVSIDYVSGVPYDSV